VHDLAHPRQGWNGGLPVTVTRTDPAEAAQRLTPTVLTFMFFVDAATGAV